MFFFYKEKKRGLFIDEILIEINFSQNDCRFVFFYDKGKNESFQKQFITHIYKIFRIKII